MRHITRLLLSAAIGVAALSFATAVPAGASGESVEGCVIEEVGHYLEDHEGIEEGTPEYEELSEFAEEKVAECIEAPNVLLPETNEIIWGAVGFFVVLIVIGKFGFPAIKKSMTERSEKIQADLDAADAAKAEALAKQAEFESSLADAKSEAARIIEEARQQADQLKADQQARLNEELAAARAQNESDIEARKQQVMAELRSEVTDIAVGAAERVVGRNLDRDAQTQLIEDYINSVSSGQN